MLNKISLDKLNRLSLRTENIGNENQTTESSEMAIDENEILESDLHNTIKNIDEHYELSEDLESTMLDNERILSNQNGSESDIDTQLHIAQENLFLALGRLGYKKEDYSKSVIKYESDITNRERLKITTEAAKETFIKIVEKIYDFIVAILKKIAKWLAIIFNDLTLKSIPALKTLAVKMQVEDEGLEYLRACSEVYKDMKNNLHSEDASDSSEEEKTVLHIYKIMETFVKRYGYLIDENNIVKSIKEIYTYYKNKLNVDIKLKDVKSSLIDLSTDIDKKIISGLNIPDCKEPLIVYKFDTTTISIAYLNADDNIVRDNVNHNYNFESIASNLMTNYFNKNTLVSGNRIRSEIINLAQTICNNYRKDYGVINNKVESIKKELTKWKNETKNDEDTDTKELREIGYNNLILIQSAYDYTFRAMSDIAKILASINKVFKL